MFLEILLWWALPALITLLLRPPSLSFFTNLFGKGGFFVNLLIMICAFFNYMIHGPFAFIPIFNDHWSRKLQKMKYPELRKIAFKLCIEKDVLDCPLENNRLFNLIVKQPQYGIKISYWKMKGLL